MILEGVSSALITNTTFSSYISSSDMIRILTSSVNFTGTRFHRINPTAASSSVISVLIGSSVMIEDSEFSKIPVPQRVSSGSCILFASYSSVEIYDSTFTSNSGNLQSVLHMVQTGVSRVENSVFDGALVSDDLGTVIKAFKHDRLEIENTTFMNNIGNKMLHVEHTQLNINKSVFANNTPSQQESTIISFTGSDNSDLSTSFTLADTNFNNNNLKNVSMFQLIEVHSAMFTTTGSIVIEDNIAGRGSMFFQQSIATFLGELKVSNNVGMAIQIVSRSTARFDGRTEIINNSYNREHAQVLDLSDQDLVGGALTCYDSDVYFSGTVDISNNRNLVQSGGGILSAESNFYFTGNVMISNNTALVDGGGIYALQSKFNFMSSTYVTDNAAGRDGGGMFAAGTELQLAGNESNLGFINNVGKNGGGLFLSINARLDIIKTIREDLLGKNHIRIEFSHNSADFGGAIYVDDTTNSGTCADSTSECFIQTVRRYSEPFSVSNNQQNVYFVNNSATQAGNSLFGGLLDRCALSRSAERRSSQSSREYFMNITDASLDDVSSYPVQVCACENNQPACHRRITVSVQKGHPFRVNLSAVDQAGSGVPATIRSSLHSGNGRLGDGQFSQEVSQTCKEIQYNVFSPLDSEQINLYAEGPCNDIGISQQNINLQFLPCNCPTGFEVTFNETECVCGCDSNLSPFVSECSIEDMSLTRVGDHWLQIDGTGNYITYPVCPFDYCRPSSDEVTIHLNSSNSSDVQCAFNRSGILCGACSDGLSVTFGSSQCKPCSDSWIALLVVFAIAGIALVVFLLVFNFTVAIGTLNGLIFYANVVGINSSTLLPFNRPSFSTIFIAWLNLDFGFETCFYDGMDSYAKTWLRLVFPAYIIFLVIMTTVISSCSQWFSNLLSNRNPIAALATLILLSYASVLRTVITILSPATLRYSNGSSSTVWLVDGNVRYFGRDHIFLIAIASLILVVGFAYTIFLLCWQWLLQCPNKPYLRWIRNTKLYSFMDTYHAPFNRRYRYWTGFLLLVRVVLYIILVPNIGSNPSTGLFAVTCACSILIIVKTIQAKKAYKRQLLDILENSFFFNAILFAVATYHVKLIKGNQILLANISVSVAFVAFLAIFVFHTFAFAVPEKWTNRVKKFFTKTLNNRKRSIQITTDELSSKNDLLQSSSSHFYNLRNQLVDIFELSDTSFSAIDYTSAENLANAKLPREATHSVIDGIPCETENPQTETDTTIGLSQPGDIELTNLRHTA